MRAVRYAIEREGRKGREGKERKEKGKQRSVTSSPPLG